MAPFAMFIGLLVVLHAFKRSSGFYRGTFNSPHWVADDLLINRDLLNTANRKIDPAVSLQSLKLPTKASFIVALKHRDSEKLKQHLFDVSTPLNQKYGKHLNVNEIKQMYSPLENDANAVLAYFEQIEGSVVELNQIGTMILVTAPIAAIESYLETELIWHRHVDETTTTGEY